MIKNNGINVLKILSFQIIIILRMMILDKILDLSKKLNCKVITTEKDYYRLKNNN